MFPFFMNCNREVALLFAKWALKSVNAKFIAAKPCMLCEIHQLMLSVYSPSTANAPRSAAALDAPVMRRDFLDDDARMVAE